MEDELAVRRKIASKKKKNAAAVTAALEERESGKTGSSGHKASSSVRGFSFRRGVAGSAATALTVSADASVSVVASGEPGDGGPAGAVAAPTPTAGKSRKVRLGVDVYPKLMTWYRMV